MREPGFYWVKVTAESEPTIAELYRLEGVDFWHTAGSERDVRVSEVLGERIVSPLELELMNIVDLCRFLVRKVRSQGIGYDAKGDGFSIHISTLEGAERVAAKRRGLMARRLKREEAARARKEAKP